MMHKRIYPMMSGNINTYEITDTYINTISLLTIKGNVCIQLDWAQ